MAPVALQVRLPVARWMRSTQWIVSQIDFLFEESFTDLDDIHICNLKANFTMREPSTETD